jgi:hypothetical protein
MGIGVAKVNTTVEDKSGFLKKVADTVVGAVITATKGPLNTLTLVNSDNIATIFGPATSTHIGLLAANKAVEKLDKLYLVRVASSSAAKATINLTDSNTPTAVDIVTVKGKTEGTYYNGVAAVVSAAASGTFTLTISKDNKVVETLSCSLVSSASNYVDKIVSAYVTLEDITDGASSTVTMKNASYTLAR